MIKLLIVDDQVIFRESLKFLVEQDPAIEVVGTAGNGFEALELCDRAGPDLVLMDLVMPVCDGVRGTELIKERYQSVKILILSVFKDDESIAGALKLGADGYVLKDIKPDELILAVKTVAAGIGVISRKAIDSVTEQIGLEKERSNTRNDAGDISVGMGIRLTERELAVVRLIVDGKNNKEIGDALHFTEGSIKNIVSGIFKKLSLKDRTQLAVYAVRNKLI